MKVGAVTVTYNSSAVLDDFLRSFLRQSYRDLCLYIVDSASLDDTPTRLARAAGPGIRVIANSENVGIAKGNNQGIYAALEDGCDAILLINNDTKFGPDLVEELVSGMREFSCGMVAPKIFFHDRPETIWSAGGGFRPLRGYAGFHYGWEEVDSAGFDCPRLVQHAPACCVLVRKEVFDTVGVMDEHYFVYLDDTDFSYRAMLAGVPIMYLPSAVLFHKASTLTGGPDSEFSARYRTRNRVYFMLKHLGQWRGLYYIVAYQAYLLLQALRRKRRRSMFWIQERALVEGFRLWRASVAK